MRKVYRYEDVKKYIDTQNNCSLLTLKEEYINTKKKLAIKCKCGNIFNASFSTFKNQNKTQCNECSSLKRRDKFKHDVANIVVYINDSNTGNGCKYISGEYSNNTSKLNIECACGNDFTTDFRTFKHSNKKQCNECGFKKKGQDKKIKYNVVVELLKQFRCKLITGIDEYKNATQILDIECSCGNMFKNSFSQFKYGKSRRCNECYRKELSERKCIPYSEVRRFIEEDSDTNCRLLTIENEYVNTRLNINIKCNCGETFATSFHEFKSGNKRQCNECGLNLMRITDFFEIFNDGEKVNDCKLIDYKDVDGYILSNSIIKLECSCGEPFETKRHLFTNRDKNRCEKCSSALTKGEEKIRVHLNKLNINHKWQYQFNDCRGKKKPLPFDFAAFNENNRLICVIEYDGKQHFEPVNFGGCSDETALKEHENIKKNDSIKNKYCKANNIPLIRIPYWDLDNIEVILNSEFV